jgi:predicted PurR-regulated permease PerM
LSSPQSSQPTDAEREELAFSTERWRKRFYVLGAIVLAGIIVWAFGLIMGVLAVPFSIVLWCAVFILCLYPLVDWLQDKGINRGLGTTIAYVAMVAVVALIVWIMVSPVFGIGAQFASINDSVPQYIQGFNDWFQSLSARYSNILNNQAVQQFVQQASDALYRSAGAFSSSLADGIVGLGTFIVNSVVVIGFSLVISFWILMDLPGIRREARRLVKPGHADDASVVSRTFNRAIGGYIKGTLLQCLIIGAVCGVGYAVIGVPNAAACGVITGILNIIPVVGPWLGGIVAGGIGLMNSPMVALVAIIIAIVVQQVVYTFISPIIMRGAVDIHPALMIFALMCGSAIGQFMGGLLGNIVGMLLAVPLTAAGKALFVYFYESRTGRQIVAADGVFFKGEVGEDAAADPESDATAPSPVPQMEKDHPFAHHYPARHLTDDQRLRDEDRKKREHRKR